MTEISLQELLTILKKKWWFITVVTVVLVAISAYISFFYITPTYMNSSTLLVNDQKQRDNLSLNDVLVYEKLIGTYKDIITSKRILSPTAEHFNMTYGSLTSLIQVSSRSNSQVITISVSHPDHKLATDISNYVAETFKVMLPSIMTVDNVQILDAAAHEPNPRPIKPNKSINIALAFILGLFASTSVVLLLHFIDSRISTEEDMATLTSYPLLGSIPQYDKKSRRSVDSLGR